MAVFVLSPFIAYATPQILTGASLSEPVDLHGGAVSKLLLPAGFTGTVVSFQATMDGTNWFNVYDNLGAEVSVVVAASRIVTLPVDLLLGCLSIKVRAGTAASASNQAADVRVGVLVRSFN